MDQHPIFIKYTRDWLHQATGFSKPYLSRVATGNAPLSPSFVQRVCHKLNQPEVELFLPAGAEPAQRLGPKTRNAGNLGQRPEKTCGGEHPSLRQAATKTDLSHSTISDIIRGAPASPQSVKRLAKAFGGYRSERPEEDPISEPLPRLLDTLSEFSEPDLKLIEQFADLITGMEEKVEATNLAEGGKEK